MKLSLKWALNEFNRKSEKYFLCIPATSFGNRAEEIKFAIIKARRENKKVFFCNTHTLFLKYKIRKGNNSLLDLRNEFIVGTYHDISHQIIRAILTTDYFFKRSLYFFWRVLTVLGVKRISDIDLLSKTAPDPMEIGWDQLFTDAQSEFSFTEVEKLKWDVEFHKEINLSIGGMSQTAERRIVEKSLKIPQEARYVCLHVRESGFLNDYTVKGRNSDINNYRKAMLYLSEIGYYVVRLGDKSMTPFIGPDKWIDYANDANNSEILDNCLIKHASLYVGSCSGPMDVALLFNKEIIQINDPYLYHCGWYKEGSLFHPKTFINRASGKIVKLEEFLEAEPTDPRGFRGEGESSKYAFIENSEDEIFQTIKYWVERPNYSLGNKQKYANDLFRSGMINHMNNNAFYNDKEVDKLQKYRWGSRISTIKGAFSPVYLEKIL